MGPLIQKTCRAVALFLFNAFALIGAPLTLQGDNGREFNQMACGGRGRRVQLDDAVRYSFAVSILFMLVDKH